MQTKLTHFVQLLIIMFSTNYGIYFRKNGGGVDKKCAHLSLLNVMSNNFISFTKYKLKKKLRWKNELPLTLLLFLCHSKGLFRFHSGPLDFYWFCLMRLFGGKQNWPICASLAVTNIHEYPLPLLLGNPQHL